MKRLRGIYLDTFTAIRQYCLVASEHEADTEERLRVVLDKFLQAQEQDIPVERITGENLRRFCENLWLDVDWKKRLWAVADRIRPMMWLLMGMCASMTVLLLIDADAKDTLQIGGWMAYGFLACTAMVLWYLAEAVCKYLLRRSRTMPTEERKGIYYIAAGLCSFGLVVMWKIMCPTLLIPVVPGLVVCAVFLSGYYYLKK